MLKIASVSGAPPQTPLGSLRRSPNHLVVRAYFLQQSQLCAFGPCNFPDSHFYQCKKTHKLSHYLKSLKICPGVDRNRNRKYKFLLVLPLLPRVHADTLYTYTLALNCSSLSCWGRKQL